MKRKIEIVVAVLTVAFLLAVCAGCQGTGSTIQEYDAEGHLLKQTTTTESVVREVTESTRDKTVIIWESGWAAYMSASMATAQDPTPTGKMFVGKTDKGLISAKPGQKWDGLPDVIRATKYGLEAGADGVKNK